LELQKVLFLFVVDHLSIPFMSIPTWARTALNEGGKKSEKKIKELLIIPEIHAALGKKNTLKFTWMRVPRTPNTKNNSRLLSPSQLEDSPRALPHHPKNHRKKNLPTSNLNSINQINKYTQQIFHSSTLGIHTCPVLPHVRKSQVYHLAATPMLR